MKLIQLSGQNSDKYIKVDDEDAEWIAKSVWYISDAGHIYRATINRRLYKSHGLRGKQYKVQRLHDILIPHDATFYVEHINGDQLDCRKQNLRVLPRSHFAQRHGRVSARTGFRGVTKHKNRFQANIRHLGKLYYLGSFISAREAALTYNKWALEFFGEYAYLNDVDSVEGRHKLDKLQPTNPKQNPDTGFVFHKDVYKHRKRVKQLLKTNEKRK